MTVETLPLPAGAPELAEILIATGSLEWREKSLKGVFEKVPRAQLEAAATLGAGPLDRFFSVAVPASLSGFLAAAVLAFAHTLGEFGVVLMLGGNIPGETQVLSIAIYNHVEQLQYSAAHALSAGLVVFSFVVLLVLHFTSGRRNSAS